MLRVVKDTEDALELLGWFAQQHVVALDTETSGYDHYAPSFRVRTIQFGNTEEAWVVPLERWVGLVDDLIQRFDGIFLIHNSAFDVKALARHGIIIPWHKIEDTMIAMRLAEPHRQAGLKEASARHVSKAAADSQKDLHTAMRRNQWDWDTVPLDFPAYYFYAAMDVILTSRLRQTPVCRRGIESPLFSLEMDVRKVCTQMEHHGMRVDTGFCQETLGILRDEAAFIKQEIEDDYGFSLTSNEALAKWLLGEGAPLTHKTEKGRASVSREALEDLRPLVEGRVAAVIDSALRVRKIGKLSSSYYENFLLLSNEGLLHPSIETIAARTGRMSIRNPALQTLPRADDPDAKMVRQAVIPRDEGEVLIACDYSQIELRCIASFSGDEELQQAFLRSDASGGDFFTEATRVVYNDHTIGKGDRRRTGVKTLFYASSYGAGINKMAHTAGMAVDEMRSISDAVFGKYPGIKALMKACERSSLENDNWIVTPAGRAVWVDPDVSYKALNALIQGHAADVFKQALVHMAHAGLEDMMCIPIHDEILLSVPKDDVVEVSNIVRSCMTDYSSTVPLLAEPGPPALTWGEAK